jgi:hypothetical protein
LRPLAEPLEGRVFLSHTPDHADPLLVTDHTYSQSGEVEFEVRFADSDGVDPASLVGNNGAVTVALPSDPAPLPARFVSIDDTAVGPQRIAVYRATVPPGSIAVAGSPITVNVVADQVRDALGNPEPGATLGPLQVYDLPADLTTVPAEVPANVQGTLVNVFTVEGTQATTPLALRRVFADANANGVFDVGEAAAETDLDGRFKMFAQPDTQVRADLSSDWTPAFGAAASVPVELRPNTPELRVSMVAPAVVDILVAYAGVATGPGFTDLPGLQQRVHDEVVGANRFYANSETNTVLNLVGVLPAWYPSNGLAKQDLQRLRNPRDGALDEVHAERDRVGADVVVLIPSPENERRDRTLGIAYQLSRRGGDPRSGFAFVHSDSDAVTLAHEVGHLLGAGHERAIERGGITPYAHGLVANNLIDVMAYGRGGEFMVPFFSNPRFTFQGTPLGDPATQDNARVVRDLAPVVSGYRPVPTGGPTGTAPSVDLAVTADGRVKRPLSAGGIVTTSVRVSNVGQATAAGSVGFDVFLSTDDVLDDADVRVGSGGTPRALLKPGKSKRFRFRFGVPQGLVPGTYHVLVRAAGGPTGGEPNLANNTAPGPSVEVTT